MRKLPKLHYTQVLAVLFWGTAFFIIGARSNALNWMLTVGMHADAFAIILSLAGAVLLTRPSRGGFILCLFPLAFYAVANVFGTAALPPPQPKTIDLKLYLPVIVVFNALVVILPLSYYHMREWNIYHVYSYAAMALGMAILSVPSLGAVGWLSANYKILASTSGGILIAGAFILLITQHRRAFMLVVYTFILYSLAGVASAIQSGNIVGAFISMIVFVTVSFTSVKARDIYGMERYG